MKASELIKRLQELVEEYGDCDVIDGFDKIFERAEYDSFYKSIILD